MGTKLNLLNQKFGKLTVIEETNQRKNNSILWKCKCDCGNEIFLTTKNLRNDGIIQCKNCGTNREPKKILEEIIGNKYNHLTVLSKTDKLSGGKVLYECECDCPKHTRIFVNRTDLISGHTGSCGCKKIKYKIGDIINNKEIIGYDYSVPNRLYYQCKCLLCGNIYSALGQSLEKTIGCGCQSSLGEFYIIKILNDNNIQYKSQYIHPELPKKRFDFAIFENNKLIRLIEFDGEQHFQKNIKDNGWNTIEHYKKTIKNDIIKNNFCKEHNIPLARIPYTERNNLTLELLFNNKYLIDNL